MVSFATSPVILVTGGTGIVGAPLVRELSISYPFHRIAVLTRKPQAVSAGAVFTIEGDLTRPHLGLSGSERTFLQARTRLLVHCAADTRFNLSLEKARQTNTEGTRNALDFALGCPNLAQFAHIGTLYIAGYRHGSMKEEPLRNDSGYVNSYERSKHEAEELVLASRPHLPVGIYRLSSVVDESGSGGHFRQLIRLVPWSAQFPFLPGCPGVPVDLISSSWAARVLCLLIAHRFEPGCIRHVCSGPDASLNVAQLMDLIFEAYEKQIQAKISRPRLVSIEEFAKLRKRIPERSPAARAFSALMTFLPHLSIRQPFEVDQTGALHKLQAPHAIAFLKAILAAEFQISEAVG